MVWFQCEDCGENLKKPKLPNHFRSCSAYKLSCIDCGKVFDQQSVQGHTQCITEAEKYGPKDQARSPHNPQQKSNKPKQIPDFDINVGLSSHPPWSCSLCNTNTTSKQTLLLHAEGKKHRAKARAFHNSQKEETTQNKDVASQATKIESDCAKNVEKQENSESTKDNSRVSVDASSESLSKTKSKDSLSHDQHVNSHADEANNREVIQTAKNSKDLHSNSTEKKQIGESVNDSHASNSGVVDKKKIKWKKLATSILKTNSDGCLKKKKLQKLVLKTLKESGIIEDKLQLRDELMRKITSSSRFVIEDEYIRLVVKD